MYCKRLEVEDILVETPGGIKGEYLFRMTPSGEPLPGGSKVRGNIRSSSIQVSYTASKLIASPMDKRVGNLRTQRKIMSCPKANERIKGLRLFTMYGVLYRMIAVILP